VAVEVFVVKITCWYLKTTWLHSNNSSNVLAASLLIILFVDASNEFICMKLLTAKVSPLKHYLITCS